MPTRYTLDIDLKNMSSSEVLESHSKRLEARKVQLHPWCSNPMRAVSAALAYAHDIELICRLGSILMVVSCMHDFAQALLAVNVGLRTFCRQRLGPSPKALQIHVHSEERGGGGGSWKWIDLVEEFMSPFQGLCPEDGQVLSSNCLEAVAHTCSLVQRPGL